MKLPLLSTREMRNFVLLAGSASIKEAAEKCALSQPALSLQLKHLESKLGTQLVRRANTHKGIELTPAGEEFLRAARQALQILNEAVAHIAPASVTHAGILRVACLPSLVPDIVSPILANLAKSWRDAHLSVLDSDSGACSTLLSSGKCEVAICSRPVNGPELRSELLFSERFCAVLRRDHALAHRSYLTLDDFVGSTLVNLADNQRVNASLLARAIPSIQVNTITALESLLARGAGAAIIAQSTAESIHHSALLKIPLADAEITRQIFLSWIDSPNPLVDAFLRQLRTYAKSAPQGSALSPSPAPGGA
ncbi:LysR family transcriptional regulator [uncultured Pigmentiphaga sp.]|uniref:LysR family transcriptional regulator n=1 Tax=uncultured Pigmentiphaga sp. TaxID=340361 RepID=UPI00262CF349|nr:LysR family transcriptional regulator [uncultured Pigmentiphaga sp.]